MTSSFWSNLENARIRAKKERRAIEIDCGLTNNAFTQGIKRRSSPSVDIAYKLAQAVNSTIEEFVAGDEGLEYVRRVLKNDLRIFGLPTEILPVVECLFLLKEKELSGILANVQALTRDKKGTQKIGSDASDIAV